MKQVLVKWAVVCALALGASACLEVPEPQQDSQVPQEPVGEQEQAVFNVPQSERIRYRVRPIIYPNNFTNSTPLTDEQIYAADGGLAPRVEAAINEHMLKMVAASNNMLDPYFSGPVEVKRRYLRENDDLFRTTTPDGGPGPYQLTGSAVNTLLAEDFGGTVPAIAVIVWGSTTDSLAMWAYPPSGFISMPHNVTAGGINHEMMHTFEHQFQRVSQTTPGYVDRMVNADHLGIDPITKQSPHPCITTDAARQDSNPANPGYLVPDFNTEEILENIMTLDDRCPTNGATYNWCMLYKGGGKFGTFSSDLCNDPSTFWLNPGIAHTWVRPSMADTNWLYAEWDTAGNNTFNVKVELLNGSGGVAATVTRNNVTGATDRGAFRYYYWHRNDLCPALQAAGAPAGTYRMRVRVDPTSGPLTGHRKDATGTITCRYSLDIDRWHVLPGHGGSSGVSGPLTCPGGAVAVGLVGRASVYVDRLGLLCATVNTDGSLGTAVDVGSRGGTGGTAFTDRCPSGQMLVGIKGRSYAWHDQISGECAPVKTWATSGTIGSTLPTRGGTGGVAYAERCPQGYAVGYLNMRAATYVDYVQGYCYHTGMH